MKKILITIISLSFYFLSPAILAEKMKYPSPPVIETDDGKNINCSKLNENEEGPLECIRWRESVFNYNAQKDSKLNSFEINVYDSNMNTLLIEAANEGIKYFCLSNGCLSFDKSNDKLSIVISSKTTTHTSETLKINAHKFFINIYKYITKNNLSIGMEGILWTAEFNRQPISYPDESTKPDFMSIINIVYSNTRNPKNTTTTYSKPLMDGNKIISKFDSGKLTTFQEKLFKNKYLNEKFIFVGRVYDIVSYREIDLKLNSANYAKVTFNADLPIENLPKQTHVKIIGTLSSFGTGILTRHEINNARLVKYK
jgi:hypothetical protein